MSGTIEDQLRTLGAQHRAQAEADFTPEIMQRILSRILGEGTEPPTLEVAAFNSSI